MDALLAWLGVFVTEANAAVSEANADAATTAANAVAAVAAAAQALAVTGASAWVSGQNYTAGQCAYSLVNYQTYRRKSSGSGTTDPSADAANWARIETGRTWIIKSSAYTASASDAVMANTSGGAWTLTLPAGPTPGDRVIVSDYAGTFGTNGLTVSGAKINGVIQDYICNLPWETREFVCVDGVVGWRSM
jgi:hypothetical protein